MARKRGVDTKIQVTRGFVTEFTPIGFPQEAAIDIDNCIIDTDGSVRRRLGIDLEAGAIANNVLGNVLLKGELQSFEYTTHLWEFVANSGTLNIIVQQIGTVVQFYAQMGTVSNQLLGELDLIGFAVDSATMPETPMEMTSGLGALFIVSDVMQPVKITYDGGSFTTEAIVLQERDFKGLDDGLAIDERPATLSLNHWYNLRNQGWSNQNIRIFAGIESSSSNLCVAATANVSAASGKDFPSNSDIMALGIVTNSDGELEFDPAFIRDDYLGNTPAPKGHFILDSFNKRYNGAVGCSALGVDVTNSRPQAIAFHQARIFYSAPVVLNKGNGIYYSQQLLEDDRAAKCFQEADPTAPEINDLIATDGGFLPIPGVGQIIHMQEISNGIIIMASNGVWFLTGAEIGSAITATSIRLDKIHSSGVLSASNIVEVEGDIYFWGVEGIMQVVIVDGVTKVTNVSKNSIQSFYMDISATARRRAQAIFIPEQRKIYWSYRDTAAGVTQILRNVNRFLILDLDVKGFYKYSIAEDYANNFPEVMGLSLVNSIADGAATTDALTSRDLTPITLVDGSLVEESLVGEGAQLSVMKLATMTYSAADSGYKVAFSEFRDTSFTDWRSVDAGGVGLPMTSFVDFAEFNLGAIHTRGRPTYVHSFFRKTSQNLDCVGAGSSDVMLVIDNTGSQKLSTYPTVTIPAINTMIQGWIDANTDILLGSTIILATPYLRMPLTLSLGSIIASNTSLPVPTGLTNIATAITLATTELTANGREGIPKLMIIITDGAPNTPSAIAAFDDAEVAALAARDAGIRVVVFGVMGKDLSDQAGGGGG